MNPTFSIIPSEDLLIALPLVSTLNEGRVSDEILMERMLEMREQNYECIGIYDNETLIGVCGMWFQTRHYAGKSCEVDHVIVSDDYRSQGIGKKLMAFVYDYARQKQCNWVELNTFVHNFPSHKFYYNEGFVSKGYHMVKEL